MPQPTVTITTPTSNTAIPTPASGTAFPSAGQTLAGMAYQIDNGPINSFPGFTPNGGNWGFTLTTSDCPTVNATYLLTVYAGQMPGGGMNTDSTHITRTS